MSAIGDRLRAALAASPKMNAYTERLNLMAVVKAGPIELDDCTEAEAAEIVAWIGNDVRDPPARLINWERRVGSFALAGSDRHARS